MPLGKLILFEGVDGCGKSTQRDLAFDYFSKKYSERCLKLREPGSASASEDIRKILLHSDYKLAKEAELMLFEAARAQFVGEILKPALNNGKLIFCDRYYYSTIAYQGFGRGIKLEYIDYLNKVASQGIEPDITFIFDIPAEEIFKRMEKQDRIKDRIEREKQEFHEKVKEGYLYVGKNYKNCYIFDGTREIESLNKEVISLIEKKLII